MLYVDIPCKDIVMFVFRYLERNKLTLRVFLSINGESHSFEK